MLRTPFSTKEVASLGEGSDTLVTTTTSTMITKKVPIMYPRIFISLSPSLTFAHRLAQGLRAAMLRLFGFALPLLFRSPLIAPGIIQGKYGSVKLGTINQNGTRSQIVFNVAQRQRKRNASHSCILPSAGYHGVCIEDLTGHSINFRLRDWWEV